MLFTYHYPLQIMIYPNLPFFFIFIFFFFLSSLILFINTHTPFLSTHNFQLSQRQNKENKCQNITLFLFILCPRIIKELSLPPTQSFQLYLPNSSTNAKKMHFFMSFYLISLPPN